MDLDLPKTCEDSTEISHISHAQFPLLLISYINTEHFSQLRSQY